MALVDTQAKRLDHMSVAAITVLGCKLVAALEQLDYRLVEHLGHADCSPSMVALVDLVELMDCTLEHFLLDLHMVVALVVTNY